MSQKPMSPKRALSKSPIADASAAVRKFIEDERENRSILCTPGEKDEPYVVEADNALSALAELESSRAAHKEFFKWVSRQVSKATYAEEELEQGVAAWQALKDSMFDGTMASFGASIEEGIPTKKMAESIPAFMFAHGYATGHGDTDEDMLGELVAQVRAHAIERCAKIAEGWPCEAAGQKYQTSGNGNFWDAGTMYDQGRNFAASDIRALIPAKMKETP